MAGRTLKIVNHRRAHGNRKAVFKREERSNAFWGPKNNPQLDIRIALFYNSTSPEGEGGVLPPDEGLYGTKFT